MGSWFGLEKYDDFLNLLFKKARSFAGQSVMILALTVNIISKGIIASVSIRYGSAITHYALRILYPCTMNLSMIDS